MVRVESLEVRTRDKIEIEIGMNDPTDFLVKLTGELDVQDLRTLRESLSLALSTGLLTVVDLSDVTFLDLTCARELATRSWLHDHLMLCDPSWEAKASLKACGREARIAAYPREGSPPREPPRPTQAREHAGVERREASALVV